MNPAQQPRWTEDLSASGRAAPAPPAAFLAAVRERRIRRRVGQSMVAGIALIVAVGVSVRPWRGESPTSSLAEGVPPASREVPADSNKSMSAPTGEIPPALTLATFYVTGTAEDRDLAPAEQDHSPVLRGGDRWDLDRARAWVLN